ncbi:MAG: rod shape-determining protein MreC [Candidatus Dormibacteraeota bacterium]|nr:rod shape-determining protein MreC [Candidatus Dormibacteraeota bacterium]
MRATSYFIVAVALAIVLISVGENLRFGALRGAAATVVEPFQAVLAGTGNGIHGFFSSFTSFGDTAQDNKRLRERVAELERQLATQRQLELTDKQLKASLGLRDSLQLRTVGATIIAQDPEKLSQSVTIDVGTHRGVKKGMSVLGQRGLVGKVVSVQGSSAQVRLITDPMLPVNVELASNHLPGTLRVSNDRMTVQLLGAPTDLKLGPGEILVTSGVGGNFPKGLPVAELVSFKYQPYGVAQVAEVTPLDALAHIEYLMVDTSFVPQGEQ